jgi:DNA polymerase alpha-associated DNA helicase A
MPTSEKELEAFITRHQQLLLEERDAEIERSALLLSSCGPKLLEQKGLALINLGMASISVGLGGKTYVN